MKTLPANVKPYQRTNIFTRETIPAGLLRDHQLKTGTWGKIQVSKGVIPPFLTTAKSRGYAASSFCFGVMPPNAILGRS